MKLFSVFATIGLDSSEFDRGISDATEQGRGFGGVMADVAAGIVAAAAAMGAALVGIGVAAFNVGRDFDGSMSAIRAQTGLTADEIDKISDGFKQMALDGGFSARELADAFSGIAVYGQDTTDALNIMSAAQTLAMATGEDLGSAAYFLGNYLLKVGKDSSYADKYIDLFAQGVRNTGIGLNSLQNYVFRMTPAFEQMGASSETNIGILTRLYQAGIRGANLYSGMGTIMMDFATAGQVSYGLIEQLAYGMDEASEATFRMKLETMSAEEQMFFLADKMANYSDQVKIASIVTDVMNQTQQAAWFEFMNLSEEIRNEVIPSFKAYGVAAQMAEYNAGGMEQSLRILSNTVEWAKLKVWDFIATPVAEMLAGAAEQFQGLAKTFIPLFGGALQGLIGILTGAEGASDKFAESIGNIASEINKQLPVFLERGIEMVLGLVTGITKALPTLISGVIEIIPTVSRAILSVLPELVTAGFEVLAALINGITKALPELTPIAIEAIITLVGAIMDNLPLLLDAAIGLIKGLANALLDPANMAMLRDAAPQLIKFFAVYLTGKIMVAKLTGAGIAMAMTLKKGLLGGKALMAVAAKGLGTAFKVWLSGGSFIKGLKLTGKSMSKALNAGILTGKVDLKQAVATFGLKAKGASAKVVAGQKAELAAIKVTNTARMAESLKLKASAAKKKADALASKVAAGNIALEAKARKAATSAAQLNAGALRASKLAKQLEAKAVAKSTATLKTNTIATLTHKKAVASSAAATKTKGNALTLMAAKAVTAGTAMKSAGTKIVEKFKAAILLGKAKISTAGSALMDGFKWAIGSAKTGLTKLGSGVAFALKKGIELGKVGVKLAGKGLLGAFKAGVEGAKIAMKAIGKATSFAFNAGVKGGKIATKAAGGAIVAALKLGLIGGKVALKAIGKAIGILFSKGVIAGAAVAKLGGKVTKELGTALKGGKAVMSKAGGGIASAFTGALKGTGGKGVAAKAGKGLLAAIGPKGWIALGIGAVGVAAYANRERIGSFFSRMGDSAREAASSVWEATKGAAERVREFVGNLGDNLRNASENFREFASGMIGDFMHGFNSSREEGYGVIRSFAQGMLTVVANYTPKWAEPGADVLWSFVDGFNSRREDGYGVIRSFFGGIMDAGREAVSQFKDIGRNMMKASATVSVLSLAALRKLPGMLRKVPWRE